MIIYQNATGNHVCEGVQDMLKAEGHNFDLAKMVVRDEQNQIIGVQTAHCSWQDSMPLIKAMKDEDALLKSQQADRQMLKAFRPATPLHRTSSQQAASSRANQAGFSILLDELNSMKRNQTLMTKAWRS
jgi:hypothetical protein